MSTPKVVNLLLSIVLGRPIVFGLTRYPPNSKVFAYAFRKNRARGL